MWSFVVFFSLGVNKYLFATFVTFCYKHVMKNLSVAIRLTPELRLKLETAAEKLGLSMHDVAKHAIRAAVEEIERNNYRIEWPPHLVLGKPVITEENEVPESAEFKVPTEDQFEKFNAFLSSATKKKKNAA